jgi:hypothetical protein
MDWQRGTPPRSDQPIIIASQDKESQSYWYNVVFYYEPMGIWYGGPGIRVRDKDIEFWSQIQTPGA